MPKALLRYVHGIWNVNRIFVQNAEVGELRDASGGGLIDVVISLWIGLDGLDGVQCRRVQVCRNRVVMAIIHGGAKEQSKNGIPPKRPRAWSLSEDLQKSRETSPERFQGSRTPGL